MTLENTAPGPHRPLSRREFLGLVLASGALAALPSGLLAAAEDAAPPGPELWVFHGPDPARLMAACLKVIDANGGFGRNVRTLALKVNAAWAREPGQGANTHPALVEAFLAGCQAAGVGRVVLPENAASRGAQTFAMSGIAAAAEKYHAPMIDLQVNGKRFTRVTLPKGRRLQEAMVGTDFLEADAVVNLPVAKNHGASIVSAAMKNWMGAVQDRGVWHRNDLHQCIADFASFLRPAWTIIDAGHIIMDHGPQGPSKVMKHPNLLILSRDQVAADAFAATLFVERPDSLGYLRLAAEMGLGTIDIAKMNIHRVEVTA